MKFFVDLIPIILFFVAYKLGDIYIATGVAIVAAVAQATWTHFRGGKVDHIQWATLGLLVVLGGATLLLHDPLFIKWKPTVVNWLFALAFLLSGWFMERPLLNRMLDHAVDMPKGNWQRLNLAWVTFFASMGILNLYVAFNFEESVWVNFKLFGLIGLTFLFVIGQGFYLSKFMPEEPPKEEQ